MKASIVIPVYNEEENINELYRELKEVLISSKQDHEIIFVDDCSADNSFKILENIFRNDSSVQIVSLLGNQGQTLALKAGLEASSGEIILAMDGDGQHDPKYIPQFISAIQEGYDMVGGWKQTDKSRGKIGFLISKIAHKIIGGVTGAKMNYFGATMKAYRKNILESLDLSGNLHRFLGALVYFKGIKIKEIPIEIRQRKKGASSYTLSKLFRVMLDLILIKFLTKYAKTPFTIFGSLGTIMSVFGAGGVAYVYIMKFWFGQSAAQNIAGLTVSSICFIIGIQFIFFGLMAEMISRVYYTSGKKFFNVKAHLKH